MKLCPFNPPNPCSETECALCLDVEGKPTCSFAVIAHELFLIADTAIKKDQ